jgi:hypothetical protein
MASSGRERHRDRESGHRSFDDPPAPAGDRIFKMTEDHRQQIAKALRFIDDARLALQAQHNAENREIIRELRASADRIFDVLNELEEMAGS